MKNFPRFIPYFQSLSNFNIKYIFFSVFIFQQAKCIDVYVCFYIDANLKIMLDINDF